MKAKIDSGAAVSVTPLKIFESYNVYPTFESENGISYTCAGGTEIPDEGLIKPFVRTKEGLTRDMSLRSANVKPLLLAGYDTICKKQRIVLDDHPVIPG